MIALGAPYHRLWAATALSNVGDGIRAAALPLLAAALTGRPELVAGVAVAAQLPWATCAAARSAGCGGTVLRWTSTCCPASPGRRFAMPA